MNDVDRLYERVLVFRCQGGDVEAFEELVERYHRRLLYYVRRMLPRQEAANDVIQDVWLDVFRSIRRLNDAGAFQRWIYQIARARSCERLRERRTVQPTENFSELPDDSAESTFSADDAEHIHAALGQLEPKYREVLILRFIEEMSYEEIAEVVGCQIGTIRSRLHYAKCALRQVLESREKHA